MPHFNSFISKAFAWFFLFLAAVGVVSLLLPPPLASSPAPVEPGIEDRRVLQAPAQDADVLPIGELPVVSTDRVALGRLLFHDPRLSADNSISCATCHPLRKGGMDGLRVSRGLAGRQGEVNAPTVFNSGFNSSQFWDGRAADLEEQAAGPIHNPLEMGTDWARLLSKLDGDAQYQRLAEMAYGRKLDPEVIANALASYQRSLVTPDAPFDRYLLGDEAALTEKARQGWVLFRQMGCVACHQGVNLGGNMFANLGLMGDYFAGKTLKTSDMGRFNITGREEDRHQFKVPGLRNVAQTGPYFHDGGVATLDEAVSLMARYQLGLELDAKQRGQLVAFLEGLTGRWPAER